MKWIVTEVSEFLITRDMNIHVARPLIRGLYGPLLIFSLELGHAFTPQFSALKRRLANSNQLNLKRNSLATINESQKTGHASGMVTIQKFMYPNHQGYRFVFQSGFTHVGCKLAWILSNMHIVWYLSKRNLSSNKVYTFGFTSIPNCSDCIGLSYKPMFDP